MRQLYGTVWCPEVYCFVHYIAYADWQCGQIDTSSQCEPHSRLPNKPYSETLQEYLFSSCDMHDSKLKKTHQCTTLQIGTVAVYCLVVIDKALQTTHLPYPHWQPVIVPKKLTWLAIVQRTWVYLLFSMSRYHYYGLSIKETSMYYRSVYSKKGLTR